MGMFDLKCVKYENACIIAQKKQTWTTHRIFRQLQPRFMFVPLSSAVVDTWYKLNRIKKQP